MKNNKGFSLVELIIVIAIMAILVGVMAPQLIKYIEKTNVSADTQLADSVKTAITTAIMDPAVINKDSSNVAVVMGKSNWAKLDTIGTNYTDGTTVAGAVSEILGFDASSATVKTKCKSAAKNATNFECQYKMIEGNTVAVAIVGSDITGKKSTSTSANYITVGVDSYASAGSTSSGS